VLVRVPELTPHYRIVVSREGTLDEAEVEVEVIETAERSDALAGHVASLIGQSIGCSMRVTLLAPGEGPRSEGGKLARVDDRRRL
jgi:phenylacetate-CoA ligase